MLNATSFTYAETVQLRTKMVGWNVPDVAFGNTVYMWVYHSKKPLL